MAIKVRATSEGFYKCRRHPLDEFDVDSKHELGSWMTVLDDPDDKPDGLASLEGEPVASVPDDVPATPAKRRGPGRPRKTYTPAE